MFCCCQTEDEALSTSAHVSSLLVLGFLKHVQVNLTYPVWSCKLASKMVCCTIAASVGSALSCNVRQKDVEESWGLRHYVFIGSF